MEQSLNPLKTRKSFRQTTQTTEKKGKKGLNPLKTRKSFRLMVKRKKK